MKMTVEMKLFATSRDKMLSLNMLAQVTTSEMKKIDVLSVHLICPKLATIPTHMLASHQENEVCNANPCEGLNPVVKMQGLIPPLECEDLSNWEEIRETYAGITCFQCFFARAKKLMRVLTRSNR
jgi:hypothetical protein